MKNLVFLFLSLNIFITNSFYSQTVQEHQETVIKMMQFTANKDEILKRLEELRLLFNEETNKEFKEDLGWIAEYLVMTDITAQPLKNIAFEKQFIFSHDLFKPAMIVNSLSDVGLFIIFLTDIFILFNSWKNNKDMTLNDLSPKSTLGLLLLREFSQNIVQSYGAKNTVVQFMYHHYRKKAGQRVLKIIQAHREQEKE